MHKIVIFLLLDFGWYLCDEIVWFLS